MKKLAALSIMILVSVSSANVFALPKLPKKPMKKIAAVGGKTVEQGAKRASVTKKTASSSTSKATQAAAAQSGKTTGAVSKSTRVTKGAKSTLANQVERQVTQAEQTRAPRLAEIPTRTQIAKIYRDTKERSKQMGNPNILIGKESDISFMRYKRNQETQRLQAQVKQMRAENQSALSQEISKYYDELRAAEEQRHSDVQMGILKRRLEQENPNAQYEHEPEMNRHLDAMDRINEAEIAAREEVAKNPGLSSVSLKEREARIKKRKSHMN